jgi:hypothetical protein
MPPPKPKNLLKHVICLDNTFSSEGQKSSAMSLKWIRMETPSGLQQ